MSETPNHLESDDDVEEILRLAIRRSGGDTDVLRHRLMMSAAELGLSEAEIQAAEQEYLSQKQALATSASEKQLEQQEWREWRRMKLHDFIQHLGVYLAVNAFLAFVDFRGDNAFSWSQWAAAAWGIAIVIQLVGLIASRNGDDMAEFNRWRKKRRKGKA